MNQQPRIMFATIPLRAPSSHIPIASLAIMSELKRKGYTDLHLFEINILRPSYEEVLERFKVLRPDIIGLSAVVSTSYAFVKKLTKDIKEILPECLIVCGGNMVASANVLLKRTNVDICCTGEGEDTMCDLVKLWERGAINAHELMMVKGVSFLNEAGIMVTSPFAEQISESRIFDVDWDLATNIDAIERCFSSESEDHSLFYTDPRFYDPKRRGKSYGRFYASKGCVARCTFCHRFTKGIRYVPIDILERRLKEFIQRFNVGFITFSDENFATHPKWIDPFLEVISKLDVLWAVGGIRVNKITADLLSKMYDAGCTTVAYGTESGSAKMLAIMEKKVAVEDNYAIATLTPEANLFYAPQMVIGMPGETSETIEETIKFVQELYTKDPFIHPQTMQVNYAQALPGTPLYEAARLRRSDPDSLDAEEEYLMQISDKNARDLESTVNHTETPYLIWKSWGYQMRVSANYSYIKKFGFSEFIHREKLAATPGCTVVRGANGANYSCNYEEAIALISSPADIIPVIEAIDKRIRSELAKKKFRTGNKLIRYPLLAYRLKNLFPLYLAFSEYSTAGFNLTVIRIMEYFKFLFSTIFSRKKEEDDALSLRTTTKTDTESCKETAMVFLRLGR
jgi:anaerobic magnesium-protoporphyrin IX monomethyl ester cyclase